jgi:MraZ protein
VETNRVRYRGQEVTLKSGTDRFVLPPEIRKLVRQSSANDRILCLQPHPELPCLVGFGLSREEELEAQIDKEEANAIALGQGYNRLKRQTELFGFLTFPFDDSGRFVLPSTFIKHAGITDRLYFQGAGPEFLVFNPDAVFKLSDEWAHLKIGCEGALERVKPAKAAK